MNAIRLVIALALACASGTAVGCRARAQTAATQPMSKAPPTSIFRFEERSKLFGEYDAALGARSRSLPPNAYRPDVDYRSELRFTVDRERLGELTGGAPSVLPALTPEQEARVRELTALLGAARNYLALAAEASSAVEALQRRGEAPTPDEAAHANKLIHVQAEAGKALLDPLRAYVTALATAKFPGDEDKQLEEIERRTDPIFEGALVDMDALGQFVRDEIASVNDIASRDLALARSRAALYLRVRATHAEPGQQELPLHVQPYDSYADANLKQEPAVSFRLNDEERERLRGELAVASEAARFIRDARDKDSQLRKDLGNLDDALRQDLKTLRATVGQIEKLGGAADQLTAALDKAAASPALNDQQQTALRNLREYFAQLSTDVRTVVASFRAADKAPAADDEVDALLTIADALSTKVTEGVAKAAQHARELPTRLKELRSLLAAPGFPIDDAAVKPLAEAAAPGAVSALQPLVANGMARYPTLVNAVGALAAGVRTEQLESQLAGLSDDPSVFDVPVEDPPEGVISLARNIPGRPEVVRLQAQLVTKDENGGRTLVRELPDQEFAVDKFGLVSKWSANLIFVNRQGRGDDDPTDGDGVDPEVDFDPAPALAWTLHFVPLTTDTSDFGDKAWKFVNPGIGLSFAALDFEDEGIQLGIAGQLTFFHDLIQVGYGYNLNADTDNEYFYIGIGIMEAARGIGGVVGGVGAP